MTVTDAVLTDNNIWFLAEEYAGLFCFDMKENQTSLIFRFDGYPFFECNVYCKIEKYENILICAPGRGNKFYMVNIQNNEVREIKFEDFEFNDTTLTDNIKFLYSCVVGGKVYFVGYHNLYIVEVDPTTGKGCCYDISKDFDAPINPYRLAIFGDVVDDVIYFPIMDCSKYVSFNTTTKSVAVEKTDITEKIIGMKMISENSFYYSLQGMNITVISLGYNKKISIPVSFEIFNDKRCISTVLKKDDEMYVIPFRGNAFIKIDGESLNLHKYMDVECGDIVYSHAGLLDNELIWAFSETANRLEIIDIKNNTRESIRIPFEENIVDSIKREDFSGVVLKEKSDSINLNLFLKLIEND